jgi:TM2 domain-containing membrane protein YozV
VKIPSFENIKFVDENGMLTPEWRTILWQLFEGLQNNFSNEGLVPPSQTAANIALLNPTVSLPGTIVYDTTDNVLKADIANTWQTLETGTPVVFPITIAEGGTGQVTQQLAIDALAGAVTSGDYLRGNGTDVVMSTIQAGDVPTLNQDTTGTAAHATNIAGGAANDIPYQTAAGTTSFITPVNSAILATNASGVPSETTTLPAISIASGTVTDPTTSTVDSINTALANINSAIPSPVSYPTTIANGGTGQITQQLAINALAGAVTSAEYLRGNGTNVTMSGIQAADVPTLNQSTSGTAANVTGVVALANGGSGQITAQLAMNAFAGSVTSADYLRGNGTNVVMSTIQAADVPTLNQSTTGTAQYATNIAGGIANDIPYQTAAGTTSFITPVFSAVLVSSAAGVPSMSTTLPGVTAGAVLVTDPTTSASATVNTALRNIYSAVPSPVSYPISLANGGTNATLAASNGGIFYSTASTGAVLAGTVTADQVLLSGSSTTPAWSTATYPASTTINQLLYSSAANTIGGLTTANSAVLVTNGTGVPSLSTTLPAVTAGAVLVTDPTTSTVDSINTALSNINSAIPSPVSYPTTIAHGGTGQITQQLAINALAGAVTSAEYLRGNGTNVVMSAIQAADVPTLNQSTNGTSSNVTGIVALANGGTNANLTASNGGIFYSTASAGAVLSGTATAYQVLLSGASTTPAWSTATYPATTTANQLLYSSAANAVGGLTSADSSVLVTNTSGVPSLSSTLPSAVQGNITSVGALSSGSLTTGFTAVTVPLGGTGVSSTTAYGVLCGGTSTTSAFQNAGAGSLNQVLTSNGASSLPTWQAPTAGAITNYSNYSTSSQIMTVNTTPQAVTSTNITIAAGTYLIIYNLSCAVTPGNYASEGLNVISELYNVTSSALVTGTKAYLVSWVITNNNYTMGGSAAVSAIVTVAGSTQYQIYVTLSSSAYTSSWSVPFASITAIKIG